MAKKKKKKKGNPAVFCEAPSLLVFPVIFRASLLAQTWGGEAAGCPRGRHSLPGEGSCLFRWGWTQTPSQVGKAGGGGAGELGRGPAWSYHQRSQTIAVL